MVCRNVNTNKNYNSNHQTPLDLGWVSVRFVLQQDIVFEGGTRIKYLKSKLNQVYL